VKIDISSVVGPPPISNASKPLFFFLGLVVFSFFSAFPVFFSFYGFASAPGSCGETGLGDGLGVTIGTTCETFNPY
jgi:hypothetical protein